MARETEIKVQVRDQKALRRQLQRLRARPVGGGSGRVHEQNVIFDTPQGGLAKHGQLLRIRVETPDRVPRRGRRSAAPRIVLTFKRPPLQEGANSSRHKVREELEVQVSDAATLTRIFEGLGMRGWFRYEKYRTSYALPARVKWAQGLLLELDETPIGTFLELEGPPDAIDRVAQELNYGRDDYILKNYLALYLQECRRTGQEPCHMLFDRPAVIVGTKKSK